MELVRLQSAWEALARSLKPHAMEPSELAQLLGELQGLEGGFAQQLRLNGSPLLRRRCVCIVVCVCERESNKAVCL
jgi:hypothetical protein